MITKKKQGPTLPAELEDSLRIAFHYAALAKQYKDRADSTRRDVQAWMEATDEIEIEIGKGIPTEYGSVIYQQRHNYRIDPDEIIAMFQRGDIAIETLVNLAFPEGRIARVEPLKVALGESKFASITQDSTTEFCTLRPSSSFKSKISDLTTLPEGYLRAEFMISESPAETEPEPAPIAAKSLADILG